jgi:hypothetical protein
MPSFRDQIIGDKIKEYEKRYDYLKYKALKENDDFKCFLLISKLLFPIKDGNLHLEQIAAEPIRINPENHFFVEMQAFEMKKYKKNNPSISINTDSLEVILKNKPENDIEGIYHFGTYFKAGLYRTQKKDSLVAVLLESTLPNWEKGNIAFVLYEKRHNHFNAVESFFLQNTFNSSNDLRYSNGRIGTLEWTKFPERKKYMYTEQEVFSFKDINENIQYIRMYGFVNLSQQGKDKSDEFLKEIDSRLTKQNLIVDVRHQTGVSNEVTGRYLRVLSKYAKHNKVYVIVNYHTRGVMEQFLIKLKKEKNVVLLGENTRGVLSYRRKLGKTYNLPSEKYKFTVIDVDNSEYLDYEEVGITPDVVLDPDKDWLQQVIEYIDKQ